MYKRSDGYWVEKIKKDGKIFYIYGKTQKELTKKLIELKDLEKKGMLFPTVLDEWWEDHLNHIAFNTIRCYKASVNRAREYFANQYIKDITSIMIQDLINQLVKQEFSKKVISTQLTVINLIFKYAGSKGWIINNPCDFVTIPRGLKEETRIPPSDEDIKLVLDSKGKDIFFLPYFLMFTSCRPGEAYALQGKDIDYTNKTISITKSLYWNDRNEAQIKETKTKNGCRVIPILKQLEPVLPKISDNQFLFSVTNGQSPLSKAQVGNWWEKLKRRGLKASAYQFRHGFATMCFEANLEDKDVQEIMGHADIKFTRQQYTHILQSRRQYEINKLNQYISEKLKSE